MYVICGIVILIKISDILNYCEDSIVFFKMNMDIIVVIGSFVVLRIVVKLELIFGILIVKVIDGIMILNVFNFKLYF